MRKVFLGCAALGFSAAVLLKIAVYVEQNPQSFIGQCIRTVYCAGIGIRPALTMNTESGALSSGDTEEAVEIPADPEPIADTSEPLPLGHDRVGKGRLFILGGDPRMSDPEPIADASFPSPSPGEIRLGHDRADKGVFIGGGEFVQYTRDEKLIAEVLRTGRLPGKIVIDDGEALPINPPDGLAPEPDLDKFVTRIEAKWKSDDSGPGPEVTRAFWQTTGEYVRPMPYCTDDDNPPVMPPADEPIPTPRKREPRRIWFPFIPPDTEVGGERELSPNGNDCREDPSAPLQIPGFLTPALRDSKKLPVGPEKEASETTGAEQKESKPAETPKKN